MPTFRTLDGTSVDLAADTLGAFESRFRGPLVRSTDAEYDETRRVWNALIDRRPSLIARCTGVADVVAAVDLAREHRLLVSVRGGGHNVSGSALSDGGLTIDLSLMRGVTVDRRGMTAPVQGGATLADVDRETQSFGLATTLGNVSETGVAGLTLNGGLGNLRRKHGLSVDNLVSAEVVTADARVLRAAADESPDLYWGVRGGGGNLGVVTSFEFRLFELGPEVFFAAQFFALADAGAVFRRWRDFVEEAPDEVSSLAVFWTVPRVDAFPAELRGQRVVLYGALYAGEPGEGEQVLAPLIRIGEPVLDLSGRGPDTAWQSAFDPFFARGGVYPRIHAYWKSIYLNGLGDALVDDLAGRAATTPSEQCRVNQNIRPG